MITNIRAFFDNESGFERFVHDHCKEFTKYPDIYDHSNVHDPEEFAQLLTEYIQRKMFLHLNIDESVGGNEELFVLFQGAVQSLVNGFLQSALEDFLAEYFIEMGLEVGVSLAADVLTSGIFTLATFAYSIATRRRRMKKKVCKKVISWLINNRIWIRNQLIDVYTNA